MTEQSIKTTFAKTLSFHEIRRSALPFFFGWMLIFTLLYCFLLPNGALLFLGERAFHRQNDLFILVWLISCPAITLLFHPKQYVPKTVFSVFIALVCFFLILFLKNAVIAFALQIILCVCVGHIFGSLGYGFFAILNNTEKFYSILMGILIPKVFLFFLSLAQGKGAPPPINGIFIGCLFCMLLCAAFFKKDSKLFSIFTGEKFPKKAMSLMVLVFLLLVINDVLAPITLISLKTTFRLPLQYPYFYGLLIGIALVLVLQKQFQVSLANLLNLSMAFCAVGFVMCILTPTSISSGYFAALLMGAAYGLGMVNIYYMSGIIAKKLRSLLFYRLGIAFSAVFYFVALAAVSFLSVEAAFISVFSVCVIIGFFVVMPLFSRLLYSGEWMDDSYRADATQGSRISNKLNEYRLTAREAEVCQLLLMGNTLRQCSAMMGIAYATVNTYCSSLYRKLGINSRTELTLLLKNYIDIP